MSVQILENGLVGTSANETPLVTDSQSQSVGSDSSKLSAYYLYSNYYPHNHQASTGLNVQEPGVVSKDCLKINSTLDCHSSKAASPPHLSQQHVSTDHFDFEISQSFFFSDLTGSLCDPSSTPLQDSCFIPAYTYSTQATQVLGTSETEKCTHPSTIRRCFNCGDPSHGLAGCPQPRNEPLIRLSRQIFQAQKLINEEDEEIGNPGLSANNVEDTLTRRKDLASKFFPGQVGPALREALFWDSSLESADADFMDPHRPMPWFTSMEKWGYPPGYAISEHDKLDPFEAVMQRLTGLGEDHTWASTQLLEMHRGESPAMNSDDEGYDSDEEVLRLLLPKRRLSPVPLPPHEPVDVAGSDFPPSDTLPPLPGSPPRRSHRLRIVKYDGAHFCPDHLPVYNGQILRRRQVCDCRPLARASHNFSETLKPSLDSPRPHPRPTHSSLPRRFSPYPIHLDSSNPQDCNRAQARFNHRGITHSSPPEQGPSCSQSMSTSHGSTKSDSLTTAQLESCTKASVTIDKGHQLSSIASLPQRPLFPQASLPSPWSYGDLCYSTPPPNHLGFTADNSVSEPYHPAFHSYPRPRQSSNVPTDENMAWYTALLSVYPSGPEPPTRSPVLLSPESQASFEQESKSEDMEMSEGSDADE